MHNRGSLQKPSVPKCVFLCAVLADRLIYHFNSYHSFIGCKSCSAGMRGMTSTATSDVVLCSDKPVPPCACVGRYCHRADQLLHGLDDSQLLLLTHTGHAFPSDIRIKLSARAADPLTNYCRRRLCQISILFALDRIWYVKHCFAIFTFPGADVRDGVTSTNEHFWLTFLRVCWKPMELVFTT